jgi:predicted Rossmann-fold nucleotide-binding protein
MDMDTYTNIDINRNTNTRIIQQVSILGWRRECLTHELEEIEKLSSKLASHNYNIFTGAGAGFMHAANKGAYSINPLYSWGYYLDMFDDELDTENPVIPECNIIHCGTYHIRKKLLLSKPVLVFCPGGMGTLDEFTEALCMKKMGLYNGKIICYNKDFWYSFQKGLTQSHHSHEFISTDAIDMVTDDIEDILDFILSLNM